MLATCFVLFILRVSVLAQSPIPLRTPLVLSKCGAFDQYQLWRRDNTPQNYTIFSLKQYPENINGSCIDCNGCQVGKIPNSYKCSKGNSNQHWNIINDNNKNNNVILQSAGNGSTCIQIINEYDTTIEFCNTSNIQQQFVIDSPSSGYISSAINTSLCLTVAYFNCTLPEFQQYPYCNIQLPAEQRVDDLVSRMTLFEKVQNLQRRGPGIPRLGVAANKFNEALHGVNCKCGQTYKGNTGCATSYPHATLLGATFNRSLWREIGKAISTEARAFANQGITGLFYYAPDINLFRDPRWGRGQEVPGEDPFLTGQYVMEYSSNMQYGEDTKYLKVVSTAKHYADYDQEGNYGTPRQEFDANVTMQDQVEYYWPAWRSAVQSGRVQSIMCSYNAVNNIPSCGNDYFMNQVVREEWGFEGFFVSDCGAIGDGAFTRYVDQQYPNSSTTTKHYQQARIALEGGCDNNCGSFYQQYLQGSVENGYTSEEDINRASKRVWKRTIELGKLDYDEQGNAASYYTTYGPDKIDTKEHRNLALTAAEQGIVLLKNKNNILPLSTKNTIALIGPHANATQDMLSNYHGTNILVNSNSPYQAFQAANIDHLLYNEACNIQCNQTSNFTEAVSAASKADYAIVFLGLTANEGKCPQACEREGWDRNTIEFPGNQLLLLQQVYAANKNTILVLINGGAIDISWPKANIPGIIEAFYPGELGGLAIRNIIFGEVSPAGKLPYTIYDKSFLNARPSIMDMSLRNNGGITYRYYKGTPVYPFGFGLSYTNFTYKYYNSSSSERQIDTKIMADFYRNGYYFYKSEATSFVVEVTNIGNMASDCVVLGFITSGNDPDAPLLKLFDFQRAFVEVGKSVNVSLSISPEAISLTNKYGNERIVPGEYTLHIGDYQNKNYVTTHLRMTGKEESIFNLGQIKHKYFHKDQL